MQAETKAIGVSQFNDDSIIALVGARIEKCGYDPNLLKPILMNTWRTKINKSFKNYAAYYTKELKDLYQMSSYGEKS